MLNQHPSRIFEPILTDVHQRQQDDKTFNKAPGKGSLAKEQDLS